MALLKVLEKRQANHVFWSPKGHLAVLAGFGPGGNGLLEFYNVDDLESMRTDQHSMASELQWDPSGRFVATSSTYWAHPQSDNGYVIWSFHGKRLASMRPYQTSPPHSPTCAFHSSPLCSSLQTRPRTSFSSSFGDPARPHS